MKSRLLGYHMRSNMGGVETGGEVFLKILKMELHREIKIWAGHDGFLLLVNPIGYIYIYNMDLSATIGTSKLQKKQRITSRWPLLNSASMGLIFEYLVRKTNRCYNVGPHSCKLVYKHQ